MSEILEVRMVPLGQAFDKLARVVRQISREHSREVNLVVTGAETEIDKLIVEELSDPLMHMIRNAIDHGIERREDRVAARCSAKGHDRAHQVLSRRATTSSSRWRTTAGAWIH